MLLETKFKFLGYIFSIIFILVNLVNLFPVKILNVFYYTNFSNVILDTSTLLLLGIAIPKFIILRNINALRKSKERNIEEVSNIEEQILKLETKENINFKLSRFCVIFFLLILLIQPINLISVLNRNDFLTSQMINTVDNNFKNIKERLSEVKKENNIGNIELNEDKIKNLELNYKVQIDNIIKNNNLSKFNQVKYVFRNILMCLVWSIAFFKLSNIRSYY